MDLMGILNITPDSFSDGGKWLDPSLAVAHALEMASHSPLKWIDIGAESTRPGAERITAHTQIERLKPVLQPMRTALDNAGFGHVKLSVDTTHRMVAEMSLDYGITMINDISAGEEDPSLFKLAKTYACDLCLMHKKGSPKDMQNNPSYENITSNVIEYLKHQFLIATASGVPEYKVYLDVGIGFGKTLTHNIQLLKNLTQLRELADFLGCQTLLGTSRKRFIQDIYPHPSSQHTTQRDYASVATALHASQSGIHVMRVHNVMAHAQALAVWHAT